MRFRQNYPVLIEASTYLGPFLAISTLWSIFKHFEKLLKTQLSGIFSCFSIKYNRVRCKHTRTGRIPPKMRALETRKIQLRVADSKCCSSCLAFVFSKYSYLMREMKRGLRGGRVLFRGFLAQFPTRASSGNGVPKQSLNFRVTHILQFFKDFLDGHNCEIIDLGLSYVVWFKLGPSSDIIYKLDGALLLLVRQLTPVPKPLMAPYPWLTLCLPCDKGSFSLH